MYSLDENKQYLAEKVYPTLRAALVAMIEEEPVEPLVCFFFGFFCCNKEYLCLKLTCNNLEVSC